MSKEHASRVLAALLLVGGRSEALGGIPTPPSFYFPHLNFGETIEEHLFQKTFLSACSSAGATVWS